MPTISTKLRGKTYKTLGQFIEDTAKLTVNNDFERIIVLKKTDKLFHALQALGKEELAKIFIEYNFTSSDATENKKYQEILNYLLAAVIEKYSQIDLLRYFFPEHISQKENRPEYSNSTSVINYCYQLFSYWLRQLRNLPIYTLKTEYTELANSIEYVKTSIRNEDYFDINSNDVFKQHLAALRVSAQAKAIFPSSNEVSQIDATSNPTLHQQPINEDQTLQALENLGKKIDLGEGEKAMINNLVKALRQDKELIAKEREAFKTENQMSQEKISALESQLLEKKGKIQNFIDKEKAFEDRVNTLTTKVEEELQEGWDKLIKKEHSYEEKVNTLRINEKSYRVKSQLLTNERQQMEQKMKDLEKKNEHLTETISKQKQTIAKQKKDIQILEEMETQTPLGTTPDQPLQTSSSSFAFFNNKEPAANHFDHQATNTLAK